MAKIITMDPELDDILSNINNIFDYFNKVKNILK